MITVTQELQYKPIKTKPMKKSITAKHATNYFFTQMKKR